VDMEVVVTTLHQFMRKRSTFNQFTSNLSHMLNRFIQNHIMVQVVLPVDMGAVGADLSLTARVRLLVPAGVTGESVPYSRNER
jgi:hypothetical protein